MTTLTVMLAGIMAYAVWQYRQVEKHESIYRYLGVPFYFMDRHGYRAWVAVPLWYLSGRWVARLRRNGLAFEWQPTYAELTPRERFERMHCGDWSKHDEAHSAQARFMAQPLPMTLYVGSVAHHGDLPFLRAYVT